MSPAVRRVARISFKYSTKALFAILILFTSISNVAVHSQSDPLAAMSAVSQRIQEIAGKISAEESQKQQEEDKKQAEKIDLTGNCSDPIGWIEIEDKREADSKFYHAPRNRQVNTTTSNPTNRPGDWITVSCTNIGKIHYRDTSDNKLKNIDNSIEEIAPARLSRELSSNQVYQQAKNTQKQVSTQPRQSASVQSSVNISSSSGWVNSSISSSQATSQSQSQSSPSGSLISSSQSSTSLAGSSPTVQTQASGQSTSRQTVTLQGRGRPLVSPTTNCQQKSTPENGGYIYRNRGNDFTVYFNCDPNLGWIIVKRNPDNTSQQSTLSISRIILPQEQKLSGAGNPIIAGSRITFPEVLPSIDLVYIINPEGVSKEFVLKDAGAFDSDLSGISFELGSDNKFNPIVKEDKKGELGDKLTERVNNGSKVELTENNTLGLNLQKDLNKVQETDFQIKRPFTFLPGGNYREENWIFDAQNKTYTIKPNLDELKKLNQFPIRIDPEINTGGPTADAWIELNGTSARGQNNPFHLLVGGNARYNCNGLTCWANDGRALMRFNIPAEARSSQIVDARLWVEVYDGNGGGFAAQIRKLCNQDFNETQVTWRNQYCDANAPSSSIWFDGNPGARYRRVSESLADLLRSEQGSGRIGFELRDSNEGATRGSVFCSKDLGNVCTQAGHRPNIQIMYNRPPSPPQATSPNGDVYSRSCSRDGGAIGNTESVWGNCSIYRNVRYIVDNVNDGDGGNGDFPSFRIFNYNQQNRTSSTDEAMREIAWVSPANQGRNEVSRDIESGVHYWRAENRDRFDSWSGQGSAGWYMADNGTPQNLTGPQIQGMRSVEGVNWIGRSDPNNSTPQITAQVPQYIDNLTHKVVITPEGNSALALDAWGATTGNGTPINIGGKHYGWNQKWTFDGTYLRANNSTACISSQNGDAYVNTDVWLWDCNGGRNQEYVFNPDTKELKVRGLNKCLDAVALNGGQRVRYTDCNGSPTQKWNLESLEYIRIVHPNIRRPSMLYYPDQAGSEPYIFGTYQDWSAFYYNTTTKELRTKNNNCLDARGVLAGQRVYLHPCHGGINQKWEFKVNNGITSLITPANPNLCVHINTGDDNQGFWLQPCNGTVHQHLIKEYFFKYMFPNVQISTNTMISTSPNFEGDRTIDLGWQASNMIQVAGNPNPRVYIRTRAAANKQFDAQNALSGDDLTIFDAHGGLNQQFNYNAQTGEIKNVNSMCLDAWSGAVNGSRLYFNPTCHGGNNQRFDYNSATAEFKMRGSNHCIDIPNTTNTSRMHMWDCHGGSNQKWDMANVTNLNEIQDNQTYYLTTKANDGAVGSPSNTSWWTRPVSFNVDTTLPQVGTMNFAMTGSNQDKNYVVSLQARERNFLDGRINLVRNLNGQRTVVARIDQCRNSSGQSAKCDYRHLGNWNNSDWNTISFVWNGRDNGGNLLPDGQYELQPEISDRAGNQNTAITGNNFLTVDYSSASISIIYPQDNAWVNGQNLTMRGAVAGFNYDPVTGGSSARLSRDVSKVEISKNDLDTSGNLSNGFAYSDVPIDGNRNWERQVNLDLGANKFKLRSTDTQNNTTEVIGDTNNSNTNSGAGAKTVWKVNREDTKPEIIGIYPNTSNPTVGTTQSGSNQQPLSTSNVSPDFSFVIRDVNNTSPSAGNLKLVSGLNIGTNPRAYDISLLRSFDGTGNWREIPIYRDGANISDPNPSPRLASDLTCNPMGGITAQQYTTSNAEANVLCTLRLSNLQLDGFYRLQVKVSDRAGNQSDSSDNNNLRIKTSLYSQITSPALPNNTSVNPSIPTNSRTARIEGQAEKGSSIQIFNNEMNRNASFVLNEGANNAIPEERQTGNNQLIAAINANSAARQLTSDNSRLNIDCNLEPFDHDSNQDTPRVEICKYAYLINHVANTTKGTPATNTIRINARNIASSQSTFVYRLDLFDISLSSTSPIRHISPNGDGKFDDLTFNNSLTGIDNSPVAVRSYSATLTHSNGRVLWARNYTSPNPSGESLPDSFFMDGKINQTVSGYTVGNWLPDSAYTYKLTVVTASGLTFESQPQSLVSKTVVWSTDQVSISTPTDGFTTTRGVVNVQGQAPASINGQNWIANICADIISTSSATTAGDTNTCVSSANVNVGSTGFFSVILSLPHENSQYRIRVKATNQSEVSTPENSVIINYSTPQSILNVDTTTSLDGVNTRDELNCLFSQTSSSTVDCNSFDINKAKSLRISTTVTRGTEALEIDFADLTNLNQLPNTDSSTGFAGQYQTGNRIAIINDSIQTNTKFNPALNASFKRNMTGTAIPGTSPVRTVQSGKDLAFNGVRNTCAQENCNWKFNYVYPYFMSGGKYEIRIRSFKGETVEEVTKSFEVNGQIKTSPVILRTDRSRPTARCQFLNAQNNNTACGDIDWIAANSLLLPQSQQNPTNIINYYTSTNSVKLWLGGDSENRIGYQMSNADTNSNIGALSTLDLPISGVTSRDITLPDVANGNRANYLLQLGNLSKNPDGSWANSFVANSVTTYRINLDKQAPTLNWVQTTTQTDTNTMAVNPWLKNGDKAVFEYSTSEPLDYSYTIAETGYRDLASKVMPNNGRITVNNQTIDCSVFTQLQLGSALTIASQNIPPACISAHFNTTDHKTQLTVNREGMQGAYYPSIFVQDLAGNTTLFGNDDTTLNNTRNNVRNSLSQTAGGTTYYNLDTLAYAPITRIDPSAQAITSGVDNNGLINGTASAAATSLGRGTSALSQSYPYSTTARGKSLDFRLFIDTTKPFYSTFDLKGFGNKDGNQVLDGMRADGIGPEYDRLQTSGTAFVTRNDQLQLKARMEKGMRVMLVGEQVRSQNNYTSAVIPEQKRAITQINNLTNQTACAAPSAPTPAGDNVGLGGIITRFGQLCESNISHDFVANGSNGLSPMGNPLNYASLSFYIIDLAGNTSNTIEQQAAIEGRSSSNYSLSDGVNNLISNSNCNYPTNRQQDGFVVTAPIQPARNLSCPILVYHDKQSPLLENQINTSNIDATGSNLRVGVPTRIEKIFSSSYGQEAIPDFWTNSSSIYPITKDTTLSLQTAGEQLSDIEYQMRDKNNSAIDINQTQTATLRDDNNNLIPSSQTTKSIVVTNGNAGSPNHTQQLPLGSSRDEDNAACVTTTSNSTLTQIPTDINNPVSAKASIGAVANRRLGTCQDGLYRVQVRHTDTAGNRGGWIDRIVERDTVSPSTPNITVGKRQGRFLQEWMTLNINGEASTSAEISITGGYGLNSSTSYRRFVNTSGQWSTQDAMGLLQCGGIQYTIQVKLTDRAGNISSLATATITTGECPTCSRTVINTQGYQKPTRTLSVSLTAPFGYYFGTKQTHRGIDYASGSAIPIYPTKEGKVIFANYSYNDDYGKSYYTTANGGFKTDDPNARNGGGFGNYVAIEHEGGIVSIYSHLAPESNPLVSIGQNVGLNSIIGRMGSTGNSSGRHLHFQVENKNIAKSPSLTGYELYGSTFNPENLIGNTGTNLTAEDASEYCTSTQQGGTSDAIYGGWDSADNLEGGNLSMWLKVDRNNKIVEKEGKKEADLTPRPLLTYIDIDSTNINAYGLGIYKNMRVRLTVDKEVCVERSSLMWIDTGCKTYAYQSVIKDQPHSIGSAEIRIDKIDSIGNRTWDIATINNDNPQGKFKVTIPKSSVSTEGNNPDKLCVKTRVGGTVNTDPSNQNLYNPAVIDYNIFDLWGNCLSAMQDKNLERPILITSNRSETGGKLKHETDGGDFVDRNLRKIKLQISKPEHKQFASAYPKGRNVWLVSHGWNDTPASFTEIASKINEVYPNDIVVLVDWSEASFADHRACPGNINCPASVQIASTWIDSVAEGIYQRLSDWGLDNGNNLRVVGHSLGSILSGEISVRMPNRAKVLIALDAPNEEAFYPNFKYLVAINQNKQRKNFNEYAQYSRAFFGASSISGNPGFSHTATESYIMDYGTPFGNALEELNEHWYVHKSFARMIKDVPLRLDGLITNQPVLNLQDIWVNHANDFIRDWQAKDQGAASARDDNSVRSYHHGKVYINSNDKPNGVHKLETKVIEGGQPTIRSYYTQKLFI